jgi:EAL domain-containing protein (putative c-di-GMP-specific phosphodiesterase class I)/CHASE2 domain-containing sensor protein
MISLRHLPGTIVRSSPMRIVVLAGVIGMVVGLLMLLGPLEEVLKIVSYRLRMHPASGQIVLVAVDDRSLAELRTPSWSRASYAQLIERLHAAGANRIVVDADTTRPESPARDRAFQDALRVARPNVWLTEHSSFDEIGKRFDSLPLPAFGAYAHVANANTWVERNSVWIQFYAVPSRGRERPSVASVLGGHMGPKGTAYPINFSIDYRTIPVISAADILRGEWRAGDVAGRDVVIGDTSNSAQRLTAPGNGLVPTIIFQIIGAETLREGVPVEIGWLAPLFVSLAMGAAFLSLSNRPAARAMLFFAILGLAGGPLLLDSAHISGSYTPSLAALLVIVVAHLLRKMKTALRTRATLNPISGMKNFNALRLEAPSKPGSVLAARVLNYPAISAALTPQDQRELLGQIKRRLLFAAATSDIFQGDEGIFAWTADSNDQELLGEQLDALNALFRNPVVVATRLIDLAVTFGLDVDTTRPVLQRASSALVAADEAAQMGRRWLTYDSSVLKDSDWRLSVLARLDQAVDAGEIWVAYQPKLDLLADRVVGAEALARWAHPERGEISPGQFIPAAERGDRIEKLTQHVLEHAIRATALINRDIRPFEISVNLSARLLVDEKIIEVVSELLRRYGLPPERLILEVTETAAMDEAGRSLQTLESLASLGVGLSIDDYGTGFSTLEYLRRIPAKEIKIDRSFVSMLDKSQSDRIMVNSTIQLAHSLGRMVVAEGVETAEVLRELRRMGCDLAQGYHIGRPVSLDKLLTQPLLAPAWRAA